MKVARAFTIIELLVVLAALALLLTLASPRYGHHVDRGREAVLRHNLAAMREAIDKFHADRGRYPRDLGELVSERYLRQAPLDPVTERNDSWVLLGPGSMGVGQGGVVDVRSGAPGRARDGTPYGTW